MNTRIKMRLLLSVFSFILIFNAANALAESKNDKVKSAIDINNSILKLHAEMKNASGKDKKSIVQSALPLLKQRLHVLKDLIKTNPKEAEGLSFPADLLAQLRANFPAAAPYLETTGQWTGELQAYYIDMPNNQHKVVQLFKTNGERLEFYTPDIKLQNAKSGTKLKVNGIRANSLLLASGSETVILSEATTQVCSTTGNQNVLTVLANLKDFSLPNYITSDYLHQILFGDGITNPDFNVNNYLQENSVNQIQLDASNNQIIGPYTLSYNYNGDTASQASCDWQALENDIIALADANVDLQQFSRLVFVTPDNRSVNSQGNPVGCGFAGLSSVGCTNQNATTAGDFTASNSVLIAQAMDTREKGMRLTAHELGHALGLGHARMRDCYFGTGTNFEPLGALNSPCAIYEYDDYFSTMGGTSLGFYSAKHAANELGWLQDGLNYLTIENSGTYTIQNYEDGNVLKALKIRRGSGNNAWLWVEARRNVGIYDSLLNPNVFTGALIHYEDSITGFSTDLLDFTQQTDDWADPNLAVGQTWNDPFSNLAISILSETANTLTVGVDYVQSEPPCTPIKPGIVMTPASVSMLPGTSSTFTVDVSNLNPSSCATFQYEMIPSVPTGGFSASFNLSKFWLKPGETKRVYLTLNAPSTAAIGTYFVSAKVFDGPNYATAQWAIDHSTVYITGPVTNYTLSLTKTGTSGTVNMNPPNVGCSGTCSQQYESGTSVVLTAQPGSGQGVTWSGACTGTATTCSLTMNNNKSVTATFAPVTYTLTVTKTGTSGTVNINPPNVTCSGTCSQQYGSGTSVVLTAQPGTNQGVTWSGACTGTATTCTLNINSNKSVTATFKKKH